MIKITENCGRCNRSEDITVETVEAATAAQALTLKREAASKQICDFFASLDKDSLPMYVGVYAGEVTLHTHLCSSGGPKSNCDARVGTLVKDTQKLEARKPRAKKETKASDVPGVETDTK